ncbi:PulJ/GspJ family protein [Noviherbaspirillum sp.]|uniref:PulJ/GspJ family protein n=1 Tax=Noviherbaspirillum sp. TaxID=1926288 RepID=UPI002B486C05|nr:prepilin-type N-terminal cleavage/methylation domain-containing protein [Noviherbaspirillum sp.]HJV81659.1 prepilin-type N-terminal cleavage/methylation domain-containing protein [Noviherbaspirillum sp.]
MNGKRRGFTLIELLVAISVLAIVAVLGWRGLDSIIRARVALTSELEETRGLQLAFAQMQSDCGNIVDQGTIGAGRQILDAQAGRLSLVRTVFAENQPSRVQVVSYRLENGVLIRRESLATRDLSELDAAWKAATSNGEIGPAVALNSDIDNMAIRVWKESTGWTTDASIAPTPAPAPPSTPAQGATPFNAAVPSGVEVALHMRNRGVRLVKIFLLGPA